MSELIARDRSLIPACDVDLPKYEDIVRETHTIRQIGAYKLGAALALTHGLPRLVEIARKYTDKPLIYDHQKAATDIPDTGKGFMAALKSSGVDAVILFPLSGPATQTAWILSAKEAGLPVLIGGHMTHERFLASEGGYIADAAVQKIFFNAANQGVIDYVVPGNKPSVIAGLRKQLEDKNLSPVFYAPGFIAQGGKISDAAAAAGPRWHAIVGRAIYDARDIQTAAADLAANL